MSKKSEYNKRYNVTKECECCGKEFSSYKWAEARFCSKECVGKYNSERLRKLRESKSCDICGSKDSVRSSKKYGMNLCQKHYSQMNQGGIKDRTKMDRNEITVCDNYSEILLYNKHGDIVAKTKIDTDDIDLIKDYKWGFNKNNGYVESRDSNKKVILLHRIITSCPNDKQVDHISGDKLDNTKNNLRICSNQQNSFNHKIYKTNTSGCPGVYPSYGKWIAYIFSNGKQTLLGRYVAKDEAIKARKKAEEEYYGEYRYKAGDNV